MVGAAVVGAVARLASAGLVPGSTSSMRTPAMRAGGGRPRRTCTPSEAPTHSGSVVRRSDARSSERPASGAASEVVSVDQRGPAARGVGPHGEGGARRRGPVPADADHREGCGVPESAVGSEPTAASRGPPAGGLPRGRGREGDGADRAGPRRRRRGRCGGGSRGGHRTGQGHERTERDREQPRTEGGSCRPRNGCGSSSCERGPLRTSRAVGVVIGGTTIGGKSSPAGALHHHPDGPVGRS